MLLDGQLGGCAELIAFSEILTNIQIEYGGFFKTW